MKPTFIGQLRYVKRIDKQYHEGASYNNILQQFDGKEWNDVNSADAVWETPEQEKKYNKAQAKEYIFR